MALTKIKTGSIADNAVTDAKVADNITAGTAATLATARSINGVSFNGSSAITVTAAAGTLTGNTLASGVTASSLTSVGTLTSLTLGGNLDIPEYLRHVGDTDTHLRFSADDSIEITAGNVKFMRFLEDDTQDMLVINEDSADIDFSKGLS